MNENAYKAMTQKIPTDKLEEALSYPIGETTREPLFDKTPETEVLETKPDAPAKGFTEALVAKLQQQLAAEQLNNAKLREALLTCKSTTRIGEGDDPDTEYYFSHYDVCTALTLPHDDTALREWGARLLEKVANEAPGDSVWKLFSDRASRLRSGVRLVPLHSARSEMMDAKDLKEPAADLLAKRDQRRDAALLRKLSETFRKKENWGIDPVHYLLRLASERESGEWKPTLEVK
jgi:hypothetical protein